MAMSLLQQSLTQVTATWMCSTLYFHSVWYFCHYSEKSAFVLKTLKLSLSTCCAKLFIFLPLVFRSHLLMPVTPQVGNKLPAELWNPGILAVVFISVRQQLILSNTLLLKKETLQAFPTLHLADLPTLLGFNGLLDYYTLSAPTRCFITISMIQEQIWEVMSSKGSRQENVSLILHPISILLLQNKHEVSAWIPIPEIS